MSPLPSTIYAREPNSYDDELEFSQCSLNTCPRRCNHWDYRENSIRNIEYELLIHVLFINNTNIKRNNLCIFYIRVRKEDIIKRFGFVPVVGRERREPYGPGTIIRSWWRLFWKEYELAVQCNEPWCEVKSFPGEYP